jgi:hypothetical protein
LGAWTGGGRCARPPAILWDPAGVGCGAGGGAAGVSRPKGPAVLPARPSGPGRTDHDLCRPKGPTIPLDARAVRGTVGPLGRTGWWWQPPGPSTLAGRTAGPLGRTDVKRCPEPFLFPHQRPLPGGVPRVRGPEAGGRGDGSHLAEFVVGGGVPTGLVLLLSPLAERILDECRTGAVAVFPSGHVLVGVVQVGRPVAPRVDPARLIPEPVLHAAFGDNCLDPSRTLGLEAGLWADDLATPPGLLQRGITLRKNDLFQAWQLVGAEWGADRAM